jgi:signal peptidase I
MKSNMKDKKIKKDYKIQKNPIKKFWYFIWYDDSLLSYILNFIVAFLFIKYILFPGLGLILNNDFPIVAIVTGSMEHKIVDGKICDKDLNNINKNLNLDQWWEYCGSYYKNFNISKENFSKFPYKNGLNIGDVMILYGKKPEKIEIGDVLVFNPQDKIENNKSLFFTLNGPVIHRVINIKKIENNTYFQTKGDHNAKSIENHERTIFIDNQIKRYQFNDFETKIPSEDTIAVAIFRIPYIGYAKLYLNNLIQFFKNII